MKTKTHFAFRIDVWGATGERIVEHLAGLDNHGMAVAELCIIEQRQLERSANGQHVIFGEGSA